MASIRQQLGMELRKQIHLKQVLGENTIVSPFPRRLGRALSLSCGRGCTTIRILERPTIWLEFSGSRHFMCWLLL